MKVQEIRDRINDYETTIQGLQAFLLAVTWRGGKSAKHEYSLGRRMTPDDEEGSRNTQDVTPDATIQIGESLGYVLEAKRSFPFNQDFWEQEALQILRYSSTLSGWWTDSGQIDIQNSIGLIWIEYISDFAAYLEEHIASHGNPPEKPVALVQFSIVSGAKEFVFLRVDWGEIDDDELLEDFSRGISIPLELLKKPPQRQLKFYDQRPVTEYLMVVLWNDLFTSAASEIEFDDDLRSFAFEVSVDDLASDLQRFYGSEGLETRDRKFPRAAWVRGALDAFAVLDLAEKSDEIGTYLIKFRKTLRTGESGDLIDRFSRHRTEEKNSDTSAKQLDLI